MKEGGMGGLSVWLVECKVRLESVGRGGNSKTQRPRAGREQATWRANNIESCEPFGYVIHPLLW